MTAAINRAARRVASASARHEAPPVLTGRRGVVILGPTEARVAAYLGRRTAWGRVTIRTVDLIAALELERSEVYRITRRLRTLGLFGVENDQGGTKGGRRYWRTAIPHAGAELPAVAHRAAWARVVSAARAIRGAIAQAVVIRSVRSFPAIAPVDLAGGSVTPSALPWSSSVGGSPPTFREAMLAAGLLPWIAGLTTLTEGGKHP